MNNTATRAADPTHIDDDAPAADAAWFERARPAHEVLSEIFPPELAAQLLSAPSAAQAQTETPPRRRLQHHASEHA